MLKQKTCKPRWGSFVRFWLSLLVTPSVFIPFQAIAQVEVETVQSSAIAVSAQELVVAHNHSEEFPTEAQVAPDLDTTTQLDSHSLSHPVEPLDSSVPVTAPIAEVGSIADISLEPSPAAAPEAMSQVTSVSQLTDVQPTDWAFQALQSLVERYGCIVGYPDSTYRGNRALTRYEFAAGLNACMDRVNELIAAGIADLATREDVSTLQRLQEEFASELVTLRGRADALEAQTAELEANQFSTTTKLYGLAWFNVNGAFADGDIKRETGQRIAPGNPERVVENAEKPSITSSGLVWLEFLTSFTGRDALVTQLAVGNGFPVTNQLGSEGLAYSFGADFTNQGGGVVPNEVVLRELFYQFPVSNNLQFVVGPRFNYFRFFENNAFSYFFSGGACCIFNFITFNSANSTLVNAIDRGAGAVALWNISPQLELRAGYIGESNEYLPSPPFNSAANPAQGLFGGTNTATAELTFKPSARANLRFLYTRSNIQQIGGLIGPGGIAEPIYGIADDGFGGPVGNATADTFAFNFDWLITSRLGLFGRYAYGSTNIFPTTPGRAAGEVNAQAFQLGLAFPDLGRQGALGTLSFVVPFDVVGGREFLASGAGNGGTQLDIEASYYLPLTSNIAIVPSVFAIVNPNNFSDNPTIFVGNLRTQFSF